MHRLALSVILLALAASGQPVRGLIGGSTAPGAVVKATSAATAREHIAKAGADGRFLLLTVPPGDYSIEISAPGFQTLTRKLTLELNQELDLQAPLVPTGQRTQVEVRATAPLLRPESAALSSVVTNQQITDLPLDGRNYYELTLLLPGVSPAAQGSAGAVRGDFAVNVNGARDDANGFSLDGAYNGDPKLNGVSVTSPVDAIREFEVAASTYDASYARNAGGQVNVALKSGANAIHGTAYEFFRNGAMDARNFFAPASVDPRYRRNQFGVSLGGPVIRNRTFFFAGYEGRRALEGVARVTNVPTAAERIGDFSQSAAYAIDPYTQQPFAGNRIPASRIDAIGRNIAALYPAPNRAVRGADYASAPESRDNSHNTDVRLDHALGKRDDLMGRYSYGRRDYFEPFGGATYSQVPGYGNTVPRGAHNAVVAETHVFSPSLINEARFAFSRTALSVTQENQASDVNSKVGLPRFASNPRDNGLSFITVLGYSPLGDEYNNPQRSATNTWQLADQLTFTRGRGLFKFGGEVRGLRQDAFRDVQSRGFINFIGFTGNSLAELLLGMPAVSGGARLDNPQRLRERSYNLFAQSSFRLRSGFTLTAGLRYEYNSVPVDGDPRFAAGYAADRNNFGPRIGFAWHPGGGGAVLRGGYGVYFDQPSLAVSEGMYFNYPAFDFRLYFLLPQLPLSLANPWPSNFPFPTPPSGFRFDPKLRTPYVQHFSLGVQRQIGRSRVAELGYVGSKGTRLYGARDINQPAPSAAAYNPRPDPRFDDISRLESRANSNYHSLQASVRQQLSHGLTFLGAYTYSKSIDDASGFFTSAGDPNFPQDSYNVRAERARSGFDTRQRLSASGSWLVGRGFSLNGVLTLQSGRPFTVALPSELDNSGTGRSSLGFGANDRPNVVAKARLSGPTPERWFNTAAFAIPARGTFGNAGRNIVDGPGLAALNLSLLKNVRLKETVTAQFRFEAFNALNRTNFDLPVNFIGAAGFGSVTSAGAPRHLQLGFKLLF
ncbi:MAG: TonB-dependent receptor [Candidatus Solibacter usitatus]|nr:TonB-dependent receptor [Candidatus Solibacter usitatus]